MHALKKLQTVFCVVVAALFAVEAAKASTFDLAGSEWGFAGETGKSARFVQFRSDGKVGGHSGCNRFTGTYTQKDDALKMGPLATTRMACLPEVLPARGDGARAAVPHHAEQSPVCRTNSPQAHRQGRHVLKRN
jgi:META domain-containing protein